MIMYLQRLPQLIVLWSEISAKELFNFHHDTQHGKGSFSQ